MFDPKLSDNDPRPTSPGVAGNSTIRRLLWHGLFLLVLATVAHYSYLLFHSLAEIYSIVIATGIFLIAWNTRSHYRNDYFLFIGIVYLFVASFDTLHMLGYHGMAIFTAVPGYNLGPQLWLVARFLEAGALLLAPTFIHHPLRRELAFTLLLLISGLALWAIFVARVFPVCFSPEHGLTLFKIVGEYLIVAILLGALLRLTRNRRSLDRRVFRLLFLSILLTVASELCFTLYIGHYGLSNLVGHLFKIASFTLTYYAIIETVLRRPFALLFRDIKQRQTRLLAAQRAARLGSWSWHPGHREMSWSEEMYPRLGYPKDGTPPSLDRFLDALRVEDREALRQALEKAKISGEEFQLDARRASDGGATRYLHIEGGCEMDDECEPLLAGIVQDVTERVATEQLRKEIDSITQHDLRTPLTPIIGIPEVLIMTGKNLTAEQRQMLEDLRQSGLKMLALLNNSLTLYRIERGTYQLQPERFDLRAELREILKEVAGKADARRVACRLEMRGATGDPAEPFWIFGEKLLCYTLFANLIANAIEASPPDEVVIVELDETPRQWRIAIHNAGEVPEAFQSRFFAKYATQGKKGGTGLGTYSAMMAARAHGGAIHLHSGDGYTTITVELPKPLHNNP